MGNFNFLDFDDLEQNYLYLDHKALVHLLCIQILEKIVDVTIIALDNFSGFR